MISGIASHGATHPNDLDAMAALRIITEMEPIGGGAH